MKQIKITSLLDSRKWQQTETDEFYGDAFENWKQSCIDCDKWGLKAGTYALAQIDDGGPVIQIQARERTWEIPRHLVVSIDGNSATIMQTYIIEEINLDLDPTWIAEYKDRLRNTATRKYIDWLVSKYPIYQLVTLAIFDDPTDIGLPSGIVATVRAAIKPGAIIYVNALKEISAATTKAELDAIKYQYGL